ncbi:MAG: CNNM domain-containing protein [Saprospiraceae bacterium]
MGLLLFFLAISIVFSFLCSIWEAVLLSIPASHVEIEFKKGTSVGKKLKDFKTNIDRPLAAILTLNTIAHTVGAMGVGAQATVVFAGGGWDIMEGVHFSYESVVAVLMTLAILFLSEIFPKTIGANNWKGLTGFTVKGVNFIIYALYPLVWFSQWITKILKNDKDKSVLSRQDFSIMAEMGAKQGLFKKSEFAIINNLLEFDTIKVKDIMTPRTVMVAVPASMTVKEYFDTHPKLRFSRVPIFEETNDNITGFFLKDEMLLQLAKDNFDASLDSIKRELIFVNEDASVPNLFNIFVEKREHIAMVTDSYGGSAGLVTMEDVMETLLGLEIVDEFDKEVDMQTLARQKWGERAKKLGIITDETELK